MVIILGPLCRAEPPVRRTICRAPRRLLACAVALATSQLLPQATLAQGGVPLCRAAAQSGAKCEIEASTATWNSLTSFKTLITKAAGVRPKFFDQEQLRNRLDQPNLTDQTLALLTTNNELLLSRAAPCQQPHLECRRLGSLSVDFLLLGESSQMGTMFSAPEVERHLRLHRGDSGARLFYERILRCYVFAKERPLTDADQSDAEALLQADNPNLLLVRVSPLEQSTVFDDPNYLISRGVAPVLTHSEHADREAEMECETLGKSTDLRKCTPISIPDQRRRAVAPLDLPSFRTRLADRFELPIATVGDDLADALRTCRKVPVVRQKEQFVLIYEKSSREEVQVLLETLANEVSIPARAGDDPCGKLLSSSIFAADTDWMVEYFNCKDAAAETFLTARFGVDCDPSMDQDETLDRYWRTYTSLLAVLDDLPVGSGGWKPLRARATGRLAQLSYLRWAAMSRRCSEVRGDDDCNSLPALLRNAEALHAEFSAEGVQDEKVGQLRDALRSLRKQSNDLYCKAH